MKKKIFTNCFLVKVDGFNKPVEVCLAMKKRGFGQGMWNGSGGKPEEGESVEQATKREVFEELGVTVLECRKVAIIDFVLRQENKKVTMHTYLATKWDKDPEEMEEMMPKWFTVSQIPYEKMWASDREWLPLVLSGKIIRAKYTYEKEGGLVETREVNEVEGF